MLVLFDIDGTLLLTHGAGLRAMSRALADVHGPHACGEYGFDGVDTSGRLDSHIWRDLSRRHGLADDDATHATFRTRYHHHLEQAFRDDAQAHALPGALPLVERLRREPQITLGLLTGNYPETGRLKVRMAGFDPDHFVIGAFASDGADRRALTPVARARFAERHGREVPAGQTIIIGDTPHDVDCAKAHGCRCLAVTTGRHPAEELVGADRIVADLTATEDLATWILAHARRDS
ncbi:MAG: HAD family hydrolase [Phycisphaerales bacterium]